MNIEKIVKIKDNKYKIKIDGEFIITYDNVILNNNILYLKTIDKNLYKKIIEDTRYYDVYNKCVKYILKRMRSEKNIREYINTFDLNKEGRESIINKLRELNLINDYNYCKAYINDKLLFSKDGINKIKNELLNEGILNDIIDETLNNIDNNVIDDKLEKIIIKKINSNKKYSNYILKQKIINDMLSLGYNKDKIINIIDNNLKDDTEIINNEYSRVYLKLNKKYSGNELYNQIKKSMIQKGFNIEDINNLIENKREI